MKAAYKLDTIDNWVHITAVGDGASVPKGVSFPLNDEDAVGPCLSDPESC